MPLYSYRCNACGEQFDRKQGFEEPSLTTCPTCGEDELRKLYLPVGIVFKGSGFYATDNKSASGSNGTKSEAKKSEKVEKKENGTEPKSDPKPKSED